MTYRDFTIDDVGDRLGLTLGASDLFPGVADVAPPAWVAGAIGAVRPNMLINEKSRSEFLVAPVLRAAETARDGVSLFSGYVLNIDPAKGLSGECDFIFGVCPPLPKLGTPAVSVVEVKNNQLDEGLGQGIAQMRALQIFNGRAGVERPIWGATTTGELWRFMRLDADLVTLDPASLHVSQLDLIFARLLETLKPSIPLTPAP